MVRLTRLVRGSMRERSPPCRTQTAPAPVAMSIGTSGSVIGAPAFLVSRSMRVTVLS